MSSLTKKNKTILDIFIVFIISIFLFYFIPFNEDNIYLLNYVFDSLYLILILLLLLFHKSKYGFDMFEPIYFVSLIYSLLYFVAPIYDILIGSYSWFGYLLFEYGLKSSFIAFIGYLAFFIVYEINLNKYKLKINSEYEYNTKNIVVISLFLYFICLFTNIFYMVKSGYASVLYVCSLGFFGGIENIEFKEKILNIGFLSMLSYSLPTTVLLYWEYGKKNILKFLLFIPVINLQITRGFRFFIIQILLTFFAYYYVRTNKRPNLKKLIQIFLIIFIIITFMTLFRDTVRSGKGADLQILNVNTIVESVDATFWENLRIYKNYYGIVGAVPEVYDYCYGKLTIIRTILIAIPRILWNNKGVESNERGLDVLIGADIGRGQAYPNLGEYYYDFGLMGVVFYMGIIGFLMRKIKQNCMANKDGPLNNIIFVSVLFAMLQIIIRGYTPTNFWYIIFLLIPVWIVKISCRKKY